MAVAEPFIITMLNVLANFPELVAGVLAPVLLPNVDQLNRNNDVAACNILNAFLDQVDQQETDGQLTSQHAADLRQQATAIQQTLGCSSSSSPSPPSSIGGMVGPIVHSITPNINNLEGLLGSIRHSLER